MGIGIVISSILMTGFSFNKELSDTEIEQRAADLGMHYEDDCKVLFKGDE